MITIKLTILQEHLLNRYVSEHLEQCSEFMEYENDNLMGGFEPFAPFCGCQECYQRETLHAAFAWLETNGLIKLESDDSNKD
jgi:hypothetical protein